MKHRIIHKSIRCKLFPHICRKSRSEVIEDIERALPYLDDPDMVELSNRIIEKLRNMTDEEFERFELIEAD